MTEPDNCSVKRQLGSTNSKGLPVLFQGLSPRSAAKQLLLCCAKGLRSDPLSCHSLGCSPSWRRSHLLHCPPFFCVVGQTFHGPDCVVGRRNLPQLPSLLPRARCKTTQAFSCRPSAFKPSQMRVATRRVLQPCGPTNSLVGGCLAITSGGGASRTGDLHDKRTDKAASEGSGQSKGGDRHLAGRQVHGRLSFKSIGSCHRVVVAERGKKRGDDRPPWQEFCEAATKSELRMQRQLVLKHHLDSI